MDNSLLLEIKKSALEAHLPIIMDESLEFIEIMLKIIKPKKILEIGTCVGYSAICFSKFLDVGGVIDTIELGDDRYNQSVKNINKLGLKDKINVINGDATEVLKTLNENYDFVFIDACKSKYLDFFNESSKLLNQNGIIIADNVLFKGMVMSDYNEHKHRTTVNKLREFISEIKNNDKFKTSILNIGDGLSVSIKI